MLKKFTFIVLSLVILFGATACSQNVEKPAVPEGSYLYENKDLGFSVIFPAEFIYYQTQRKNQEQYTDLEIYVPTGDLKYYQEVSGYAKPLVFRIYTSEAYAKIYAEDAAVYQKLGEKNNKVFTVAIWDNIPSDWKDKWTEDIKKTVLEQFDLY